MRASHKKFYKIGGVCGDKVRQMRRYGKCMVAKRIEDMKRTTSIADVIPNIISSP